MKVKMTEAQAVMVATNAINASVPMGMGFLQSEDKDYQPEEIETAFGDDGSAYFDYYRGRMVKTGIERDGDHYLFPNSAPSPEYQSWAHTYPTYLDLVKSVIAEPEIVQGEAA